MEPKEWYNIQKRMLGVVSSQQREYKQTLQELYDAIRNFIVLSYDSITEATGIKDFDIGNVYFHFEKAFQTMETMLKRPDIRSIIFRQVVAELKQRYT